MHPVERVRKRYMWWRIFSRQPSRRSCVATSMRRHDDAERRKIPPPNFTFARLKPRSAKTYPGDTIIDDSIMGDSTSHSIPGFSGSASPLEPVARCLGMSSDLSSTPGFVSVFYEDLRSDLDNPEFARAYARATQRIQVRDDRINRQREQTRRPEESLSAEDATPVSPQEG